LYASQLYKKDFTVLERKPGKTKTKLYKRTLVDFESQESFDGKYFKIVEGKSDDAISFDEENQQLLLKAATTYHHLTKAHMYWKNEVKTQTKNLNKKIIIRLEIKAVYSPVGHYEHQNSEEEFNNALTVPAGQTPRLIPEYKEWGDEIWFRPKKSIRTDELPDTGGVNPITSSLEILEQPVLSLAQNNLEQDTLRALFFDRYQGPYWKTLAWSAGTFAVMKVAIEGSKALDKLFMEKYYYLDTALIPEVIYHEYSHYILQDHLPLSHSTGVVEGLADFYAAEISSTTKVYGKIKGVSLTHSKNAKNKDLYRHYHEHNSMARADFALSVLWRIKEEFPKVGNKLIYEARKYLNTYDATIYDSLLRSMLLACDSVCEDPLRDRSRLFQVYEAKGF
jgi:hypothetical protein